MAKYKPQYKDNQGNMQDIPLVATYDKDGNEFSATYVKKEAGKGLSSNDFTNAYKNLLDNLPSGGSSSADLSKLKSDIYTDDKIVAVFNIQSANTVITLDFSWVTIKTGKSIIVNWGDGSTNTTVSGNSTASHTYSGIGTYICFIYNVQDFSTGNYGGLIGFAYPLVKLILPEGITTLPTGVLINCSNLKQIILPRTITTIAVGAYAGNISAIIYYMGSASDWGTVYNDIDSGFYSLKKYCLSDVSGGYIFQIPVTPIYDEQDIVALGGIVIGGGIPSNGDFRILLIGYDEYISNIPFVYDLPIYIYDNDNNQVPLCAPISLSNPFNPTPITLRYLENQYKIGLQGDYIWAIDCFTNSLIADVLGDIIYLKNASEKSHAIMGNISFDNTTQTYMLENAGTELGIEGVGASIFAGQQYAFVMINNSGIALNTNIYVSSFQQGNAEYLILGRNFEPITLQELTYNYLLQDVSPEPELYSATMEIFGFTGVVMPAIEGLLPQPAILVTSLSSGGGGGGGAGITVDSALNPYSTNPVQNSVITQVVSEASEKLNSDISIGGLLSYDSVNGVLLFNTNDTFDSANFKNYSFLMTYQGDLMSDYPNTPIIFEYNNLPFQTPQTVFTRPATPTDLRYEYMKVLPDGYGGYMTILSFRATLYDFDSLGFQGVGEAYLVKTINYDMIDTTISTAIANAITTALNTAV